MKSSFENLDQLTDTLYEEAVAKANKEIAQRQKAAEEERAALLEQARAEAEAIKQAARREAAALKSRQERELKQRGQELLEALKQQLSQMALGRTLSETVPELMEREDFVRELILSLARDWDPQNYRLELPPEWEAQWGGQLAAQLPQLKISPGSLEKGHFRLVHQSDGWHFDFDAAAFEALLRQYLRPETDKLLFGQDG